MWQTKTHRVPTVVSQVAQSKVTVDPSLPGSNVVCSILTSHAQSRWRPDSYLPQFLPRAVPSPAVCHPSPHTLTNAHSRHCYYFALLCSCLSRSVAANSYDQIYCMQLAQNAVHGAMAGYTAFSVGMVNDRTVSQPRL